MTTPTDLATDLQALYDRAEAEKAEAKKSHETAKARLDQADAVLAAIRTALGHLADNAPKNGRAPEGEGEYVDEELADKVRELRLTT